MRPASNRFPSRAFRTKPVRRVLIEALLGLACAAVLAPAARAQDDAQPPIDETLLLLLEEMPASTPEHVAEFSNNLGRIGAPRMKQLCLLLEQPELANPNDVRSAIHGLALHVAVPGRIGQQSAFVMALTEVLRENLSIDSKKFLIEQLGYGGDHMAITALAQCLTDDELRETALLALRQIGGEKSIASLGAALPRAAGPARVAIIYALADLASSTESEVEQASVPAVADLLLPYCSDSDPAVRQAAVTALTELGDARALDSLTPSLESDERFTRAVATAELLMLCRQMCRRGENIRAAELLQPRLAQPAAADTAHVRSAVLYALVDALGESAMPEVRKALQSDEPQVRAAAAELAATRPGPAVTRALADDLPAASSQGKQTILSVLARRGDDLALPAVQMAMTDADPRVRLAAIAAAAPVGGLKAIPPLVEHLAAPDEAEAEAARDALASIRHAEATERLARMLADAPAPARVGLLQVLARRPAGDDISPVLRCTEDADGAVRVAAFTALASLGGPDLAPALLERLSLVASSDERAALEDALAAVCRRIADLEKQPELLLQTIQPMAVVNPGAERHVENYCSMLRVLGRIGGQPALEAVQRAVGDSDAQVREAAVRTLADWNDPAALPDLLRIAKDVEDVNHHVLLLRGFVRLAQRDTGRPPEQTLSLFEQALQAARRDDEKKLIISRIGAVAHPRSLQLLADLAKEEALAPEAASAIVSVGEALAATHPSLTRPAIEMVLLLTRSDTTRERARAVLAEIEKFEDFITDWLVAGPYLVSGRNGFEIFDEPFAPEKPDATVEWRKLPLPDESAAVWRVDLNQRGMAGDNRAAYLKTWVYSPADQPVRLEVGSDDGVKVWLNGKVIHANNVPRGCSPGDDKVSATLDKGWNELMLKVCNGGGAWAACLRVRRPDGARIEGVYALSSRPQQ